MSEYATKKDVEMIVDRAVDSLSEVISGFAQQVSDRFDQVDERFDRLETRMDSIENRVTDIEVRLGSLERLVENLQGEQIAMSADIKDILLHLDGLEKRLSGTEQEQQRAKQELIKLHAWVVQAAKKIDLEFPAK